MAFSDTEIQALLSLAEDACAKTYADAQDDKNRDGNPWKKYQEKADLKLQMFTSELKDMKLLLHKGVVIFEDMAPEAVLSFMWGNLEHRMTWDRQHQSLEMFPVIGQSVGNRTFVLCSRSKQVGPISPRDFCILITEKRNENGSITQGGVSLLPDQPGHHTPKPKFVRGHCYPTGSVFERCGPNGKDCRVSHTTQVDLKGWFTTRVLNSALQGSFIATYTDVKRGLAAMDASAINGSEIEAREKQEQQLADELNRLAIEEGGSTVEAL